MNISSGEIATCDTGNETSGIVTRSTNDRTSTTEDGIYWSNDSCRISPSWNSTRRSKYLPCTSKSKGGKITTSRTIEHITRSIRTEIKSSRANDLKLRRWSHRTDTDQTTCSKPKSFYIVCFEYEILEIRGSDKVIGSDSIS